MRIDRVFASMSPGDTAAALRLLKLLEDCGQMTAIDAGAWRRRIRGGRRFIGLEDEAAPNAQANAPPCGNRRRVRVESGEHYVRC